MGEDCSIQLPTPQPYPWWMMFEGRYDPEYCLFYSIMEKNYHSAKVPELYKGVKIYTSCNEWLVVMDIYILQGFLLNIASLEKINLPKLPWTKLPAYDNIVITAPPNTPDCILVLLSESRSRALVWIPGRENWAKLRHHDPQIKLSHVNVCNRKIYCIADSKYFAECKIVDDTLTVKILGPKPWNILRGPELRDNDIHMVPSGDDVFWVQISRSPRGARKMKFVDVFKFDPASNGWNVVRDIEDRVFFINPGHSYSTNHVTNSGVKRNCIYLSVLGFRLCIYDMEEDEICTYRPCPKVGMSRFIMVP